MSMNAALLLTMAAWMAGADPLPAQARPDSITIMISADLPPVPEGAPAEAIQLPREVPVAVEQAPASKDTPKEAIQAAKEAIQAPKEAVQAPMAPPNPTMGITYYEDTSGCGGNCCGATDCRRPSLWSRVTGFFRRLRFWRSNDCCEEAACGCQTANCGCGAGGQVVAYGPMTQGQAAGIAVMSGQAHQSEYAPAAANPVQTVGYTAPAAQPAGEGRAKLTISLPAGARLFVDDQPTQAGAGVNEFVTPLLKVGEEFFYRFRAEMVRDGRTVREEMRVVVQAGMEMNLSFLQAPTAPQASAVPVAGR
jgi:uncharacterized protein (TIGR03000 family)